MRSSPEYRNSLFSRRAILASIAGLACCLSLHCATATHAAESGPPEIDVMEIVNNGRDTTRNSFHNVHTKNPDKKTVILMSKVDKFASYRPNLDFADDYHTFAVEWTPDTVTHFVDGVPIVSRHFYWLHIDGSDGGPAHVLINLAVGGGWPGPPDSLEEFPAILAVKYIRVWQKDSDPAKP